MGKSKDLLEEEINHLKDENLKLKREIQAIDNKIK